jgi:hypothetical protein
MLNAAFGSKEALCFRFPLLPFITVLSAARLLVFAECG